MRALSVCLLLWSAAVLAMAAKPGPVLLSEWLDQKQAPAVPAATAKPASSPAYYEEADFDWGCFKEASYGQCRYIGCTDYCAGSTCAGDNQCGQTQYFESHLTCCDKREYGYEYEAGTEAPGLLTNMQIGSCEFTQQRFTDQVDIQQGVISQQGTFTAVCNINQGDCGHPFCDSMVLTWQGAIYELLAASATNPPDQPYDDCEVFNGRIAGGKAGRKGGNKGVSADKLPQGLKKAFEARRKAKKAGDAAAPAAEVAYDREGPSKYYLALAELYSGTVTISSRKYNLKYHTGFMDFVSVWYNYLGYEEITPDQARNYHQVYPYTYTLKLHKEREQY